MSVVGDDFQEQKLTEIGEIAQSLFPTVDKTAVKGSFRFAIKESLVRFGLDDFKSVHTIAQDRRRAFFEAVLEGARHKLGGIGLTSQQIDTFQERMRHDRTFLE